MLTRWWGGATLGLKAVSPLSSQSRFQLDEGQTPRRVWIRDATRAACAAWSSDPDRGNSRYYL